MRRILKSLAFLIIVPIILCACNRHDEPPTEVQLGISQEFLPVTISVSRSDEEMTAKLKEWSRNLVAVNSADELPEDPLGFPDFYRRLNYENQTLLIFYQLHFWDIESCNNMFMRNNVEKTFYWHVSYGVTDVIYEGDEKPENLNFTRFAILVRKLNSNYDVKVSYSIHDFDPAENPWEDS